MTEQPTPPHGADQQPSGAAENLRALRRSRDERMLAGVLGGIAQRLGVDPVLLRIVTVVLAVFGGVGIVIYAAGWLLIPDEDSGRSVAEQALGRSDDRPEPATLWLAGGLVLAVLFAAGATFGSGVGTVLLVLAVAGVIVLLRRDGDAPASRFADQAPNQSAAPHDDEPDGGSDAGRLTPEQHEPHSVTPPETAGDEPVHDHTESANEPEAVEPSEDADSRPEYVHSFTAPVQSASAWPEPPDWPASDFEASGIGPTEPPTDNGKPKSSHLGGLTLSAVAVGLGVLAINDVTFAVVPASAYVALALAIIGGGLLIGTWFGRSRSLIAWGLVGMFIALPAAAIGDYLDWDMTGEDRTITIDDAAELPEQPREHGTGRVVYDLGGLELTAADQLSLDVSQTMGQLQVVVPPEVDVTVNASTDMGHIVAFDEQAGGHQDITVTDTGPDGAGGGELTLDLAVGLGEIVVERADAPAADVNGQGVPR